MKTELPNNSSCLSIDPPPACLFDFFIWISSHPFFQPEEANLDTQPQMPKPQFEPGREKF